MYQLQTVNLNLKSNFNTDLAINWLSNSGVQSVEGGFYACYDIETDDYPFLCPRITSYAIQLLSRLYGLDNKVIYLAKAVKAGDWLLNFQKNNGLFACKYFDPSKTDQYTGPFYVFDAGLIACGLLDLYKVTSKNKYLKAALKTIDASLNLQKPNGLFTAGLCSNGHLLDEHYWRQRSSCHHLKMILPLLKLYKLTDDKKYLDSARRLLRWGCTLQLPSGRFAVFAGSNDTYTHAHCYALEGLVVAYKFFGNTNLDIALRINWGINWLLSEQNSDGSIWNYTGQHGNKVKDSKALSQALRLLLLRKKGFTLTEKILAKEQIQKGFAFLGKMQCFDAKSKAQGGISYGELNGKTHKTICACATIFAIHAALLTELSKKRQSFEAII